MMSSGNSLPYNSEAFASNRAIIRRRFPHLDDVLSSWDEQWQRSIHTLPTRSGLPTISVDAADATVHVHSSYQPVVEAERWLNEPLTQKWDFAVIFGMGLAYHLDALLVQRPQCRLVVIEPRPDVFYAALALRDQRRLLSHPYLELVISDDPVEAAQNIYHKYLRDLLDDAPLFVWPATARYASEYWRTFESQLVDLLRATRNDNATRQKFQLQWITNFFENVNFTVGDPGISALKDLFSGRPAIIASAGPSLEKNVDLLAEAKDRAVIIAAGSAINPLLKHGIEPDLLVSFDAGRANYRHFEHLCTPNLPLVYIPTIYPQIVEEYQGPRFTAAMDTFPFVDWLFRALGENKGLLESGPSVANVSWHLANILGLNPIILVGQDLAYTDGRTHAAGAAHAQTVDLQSPDASSRFITTEGIDGSPVVTDIPMYSMKMWFEQRLTRGPDWRITIDATEGGAKIAGTTIMPLRQAIDQYCNENFYPHRTIMNIHAQEQKRLRQIDFSDRLQNAYQSIEQNLYEAVRLATEGLREANELLQESTVKRLTEQRYNEYCTRLTRRMNQLNRLQFYRIFVAPVTVHITRSISLSLQTRIEKETDLYAKGSQLARKYSVTFSSGKEMARRIRSLVRQKARAVHLKVRGEATAPAERSSGGIPLNRSSSTSHGTRRITHVAFYTQANAGDTLLTIALRDLFDQCLNRSTWQSLHAHAVVGEAELSLVNDADACVIGGGGLFLKDTNPNDLSGWQWSCSLDSLAKIRSPIILFAVGYNRFRGQADFGPPFYKFIPKLVEKAEFFGLRNNGSIRAIRKYLPLELHSKVRFQPCMTTLLRFLYPRLFETKKRSTSFVAVNCAFDRANLRYGEQRDEILNAIALALKQLSSHIAIKYYAHIPSDELILPVLKKWRVPFTVTRLYGVGPEAIVDAYRTPSLVIGMRGHAQMIPFGCGVPILSLISHDKMAWFLEDIDATDWGLEVGSDNLADRLIEKASAVLNASTSVREQIMQKQEFLWNVTRTNMEFIRDVLADGRDQS